MDITDWFDIEDLTHIAAYIHLNATSCWPVGFIPEGIAFSPVWQATLAMNMAVRYCELRLNEIK